MKGKQEYEPIPGPGFRLALVEGTMILAAVLKNFRLHRLPDHAPRVRAGSTLMLESGMPMRLEIR